MKRFFKWTGIVLSSLILLGLMGYAGISHSVSQRMEQRYDFAPEHIDVPQDSAALARGQHLVTIKGCTDCHGSNLGGKIMAEDAMLGRLTASNLTKGEGGLPADYTESDWLTALRHGINHDGRPLLFMPSHETAVLSEADLAAIIAYCQQLPAVDNRLPEIEIGPAMRIMSWLDKVPLLAVEKIDHSAPMVKAIDTSEGVALGKYLSVSCSGCHHASMKGGEPAVPGQPPVPDITASGGVGRWTQAQFFHTLRDGITPAGHQLNNEEMPWKMTAQYSDKELASLYQYLRSL